MKVHSEIYDYHELKISQLNDDWISSIKNYFKNKNDYNNYDTNINCIYTSFTTFTTDYKKIHTSIYKYGNDVFCIYLALKQEFSWGKIIRITCTFKGRNCTFDFGQKDQKSVYKISTIIKRIKKKSYPLFVATKNYKAQRQTLKYDYVLYGQFTHKIEEFIKFIDNDFENLASELASVIKGYTNNLRSKEDFWKFLTSIQDWDTRQRIIEIYGFEKFLVKLSQQASMIEKFNDCELYSLDLDRKYLVVKDFTKDKNFIIVIPPFIKTAEEGRAWSFGFNLEEWNSYDRIET